jgi:hypothetical protein
MKPLVILAVLVAASSAAAQTVRQAPPPQPAPPQQQQQPLILNPDNWTVGRSATAPLSSGAPGSPGAAQPSAGPTFRPSIGTQSTPDGASPDRRQEYVPTLRLKVPL